MSARIVRIQTVRIEACAVLRKTGVHAKHLLARSKANKHHAAVVAVPDALEQATEEAKRLQQVEDEDRHLIRDVSGRILQVNEPVWSHVDSSHAALYKTSTNGTI